MMKDEVKPSEGPWEVQDMGYGYAVVCANDCTIRPAWLGDTSSIPKKVQKANAYLMVAAPDMRRALEDVCSGCCLLHDRMGDCESCKIGRALEKCEVPDAEDQ